MTHTLRDILDALPTADLRYLLNHPKEYTQSTELMGYGPDEIKREIAGLIMERESTK